MLQPSDGEWRFYREIFQHAFQIKNEKSKKQK